MVNTLTVKSSDAIESAIKHWLSDVVVGLNLCPFASKPMRLGQVRFCISETEDETDLLAELLVELQRLDDVPAAQLETTLLVVPRQLHNFSDFNQFLDLCDWLLERHNYTGIYQLATFHPDYQFAGTFAGDAENLTNRAPYPVLHLLREESLEKALENYANPESIPDANISRMRSLTVLEKQALFPYLLTENK